MSSWSDEAGQWTHCAEAIEQRRHWVPPPPPYEPDTPIILPDLATLKRALDGLNQLRSRPKSTQRLALGEPRSLRERAIELHEED